MKNIQKTQERQENQIKKMKLLGKSQREVI